MYKIIGSDQKEYGPSTADEIRQYVAEGRADGKTLVQAVGSNDWKPLASFPELATFTLLSPPPVISETAATARDFSLGGCFSRSGKLLMSHFGLLVGATFVVWLLDSVVSLIPLLGGILHLVLYGILFGGLYHVYLRCIRGEQPGIGETFMGFTKSTQQLMLVGLVSMIIIQIGSLIILPAIYLIVAWTFAIPLVIDRGMEFWSAMELSRQTATRLWFKVFALLIIAFLPFVLLNLYAMIDSGMLAYSMIQKGPMSEPALVEVMKAVMKSFFKWFLIARVVLLFNYPFALGAICYAYEDLFGTRKPR